MAQFFGLHDNKLDAKGRVSVPSAFRAVLRGGMETAPVEVVLRQSLHHACIEALPTHLFESAAPFKDEFDLNDPDLINDSIAHFAEAEHVEADKEGRIVLPGAMVRHAGLTGIVTFMGRGPLFEIWEPEAARARVADARRASAARAMAKRAGAAA